MLILNVRPQPAAKSRGKTDVIQLVPSIESVDTGVTTNEMAHDVTVTFQ
jgi:hypothetical protein